LFTGFLDPFSPATAMDYQTIELQDEGEGVRTLTLNRPEKRNAISTRMRQEISACLTALATDEAVRVLIVTGKGHSFSSGFDIREFQQKEGLAELARSSIAYHRDVWGFPKPTIAAVNGFAMGGGLDLAALCDVRLCAENAIFAHPQVRFGGIPLYTPLRWIIGEGLARDLCLTGRHIDAREAHRIGLVSEVVAPADLAERALDFARMMAEVPPESRATLKRIFIENAGRDFEQSYLNEHENRMRKRFLGE
jgi:enoyl-CoA hydratase